MTYNIPRSQMTLEFIWARIDISFRGFFIVEIVFPGLMIVAGIITLLAGRDEIARNIGVAILLPGIAAVAGAAVRMSGIHRARKDFLTARRAASLRHARRLDLLGAGLGILLSLVAVIIVVSLGWASPIGGFIVILAGVFAIFIALGFGLVQFIANGTALKATAHLESAN